jgi:hypothetical protein
MNRHGGGEGLGRGGGAGWPATAANGQPRRAGMRADWRGRRPRQGTSRAGPSLPRARRDRDELVR